MDNSDKIIVSLCAGTGAWERPYIEAGYDVRSITLPEHDVRTYQPPDNVYGILAAPPCTMFSFARTRAKTPRNLKEGMIVVEACEQIIRECRYKNKLAFWALENPMGYLRQLKGKPPFTFDPCDFGDWYTKKTDIWGYFNFPKKLKQRAFIDPKCKTNSRKLPLISEITSSTQAAQRAITPPGFALAFFKANR